MIKRKRMLLLLLPLLALAGCGGGGSDDGAGGDTGFTDNLSGSWTGELSAAGIGTIPIGVVINQPVAGSLVSIRHVEVSLNGIVTGEGVPYPFTGTKNGNSVTIEFVASGSTSVLTGALSSANAMNGNFTSDPAGVAGTWQLTR